jgi:hypothetical protein
LCWSSLGSRGLSRNDRRKANTLKILSQNAIPGHKFLSIPLPTIDNTLRSLSIQQPWASAKFDHGAKSKNREARDNWPEVRGDQFPCVVTSSANQIKEGAEVVLRDILQSLGVDYKDFGSKIYPKCAMLGLVIFARPHDPDDSKWRLTKKQFEELVKKKTKKKMGTEDKPKKQSKPRKTKTPEVSCKRKRSKKEVEDPYGELCFWRVLAAWRFLQPIPNVDGHCGKPMAIVKQRGGARRLARIKTKMERNQWVRVL